MNKRLDIEGTAISLRAQSAHIYLSMLAFVILSPDLN
jgi:hypothetical protein